MTINAYAFLIEDAIRNDFSHGYDLKEIWKAASKKEVQTYEMDDVKHWVYTPCWSDKKNNFISIFQVMNQPRRFPGHVKKIKASDTEYPLIVVENEYDKYGVILDGNHRFAKMVLDGYENVVLCYFTMDELEKFRIKL